MPVSFPHRYCASLSRTFAARARGTDTFPRSVLQDSSPGTEGDADVGSPEHMLLSSIGLCLLTTFEGIAPRAGIGVLAWSAKVTGTVEQTPEGKMFTSIVMELDMHLDGRIDRLDDALENAKQYCLVLNSMRVPVVIETEVHTRNEISGELPIFEFDMEQAKNLLK